MPVVWLPANLGQMIPPCRVARQRRDDSLHQFILVRTGQIKEAPHLDPISREESNREFSLLSNHSEPSGTGVSE